MSKIRDIAKILGRTEAANTTNVALGTGGGTDSAAVITLINQNAGTDSTQVIALIQQNSIDSAAISAIVDSSYVSNRSGGGGGAGVTTYANTAALPNAGDNAGALAYVSANNKFYSSNGSGWSQLSLDNVDPSITISPSSTIFLSTDATTTSTVIATATDPDSPGQTFTFSVDSDGNFDGLATSGVLTQANDSARFVITPKSPAGASTSLSNITFSVNDGVSTSSTAVKVRLLETGSMLQFDSSMAHNQIARNMSNGGNNFGEILDGSEHVLALGKPEETISGLASSGGVNIYEKNEFGNFVEVYQFRNPNPVSTAMAGAGIATSRNFVYITTRKYNGQANYTGHWCIRKNSSSGAWEQGSQTEHGTSGDAPQQTSDDYAEGIGTDSDGRILYIGHPRDDDGNSNAGRITCWHRSDANGTTVFDGHLTPPFPQSAGYYGGNLKLSKDGKWLIVAENNSGGRVHVYDTGFDPSEALTARDALANVTLVETLEPTAASAALGAQARFGTSLAIDDTGTYIVVGSPGKYVSRNSSNGYAGGMDVFKRSGTTFTRVLSHDPTSADINLQGQTVTNAQNMYYGSGVAINSAGNMISVCAPMFNSPSANDSRIWFWKRVGEDWLPSGTESFTSSNNAFDGRRLGYPQSPTGFNVNNSSATFYGNDGRLAVRAGYTSGLVCLFDSA